MKSPNINFPFPGWWAAFRAAAKISPTTIAAAITSLPFLSLFPFLSSPWSGSRIPADHGKGKFGKRMKGKGKGGRMCGSQYDWPAAKAPGASLAHSLAHRPPAKNPLRYDKRQPTPFDRRSARRWGPPAMSFRSATKDSWGLEAR